MKKIIIGFGTGRCGTNSLAYLLNNQHNSYITHEFFHIDKNNKHKKNNLSGPILDWNFNYNKAEKVKQELINRNIDITGDISFYHINYINYYFENFENLKFIHIKREKEEVVNSFLKKTNKSNVNRWLNNKNGYNACFPNTHTKNITKKEAISKYYDIYLNLVEKLKENIPIYEIYTNDLNDSNKIEKLLNFLEINNHQIPNNLKFNSNNK